MYPSPPTGIRNLPLPTTLTGSSSSDGLHVAVLRDTVRVKTCLFPVFRIAGKGIRRVRLIGHAGNVRLLKRNSRADFRRAGSERRRRAADRGGDPLLQFIGQRLARVMLGDELSTIL